MTRQTDITFGLVYWSQVRMTESTKMADRPRTTRISQWYRSGDGHQSGADTRRQTLDMEVESLCYVCLVSYDVGAREVGG